jgi:hypothetical protein
MARATHQAARQPSLSTTSEDLTLRARLLERRHRRTADTAGQPCGTSAPCRSAAVASQTRRLSLAGKGSGRCGLRTCIRNRGEGDDADLSSGIRC